VEDVTGLQLSVFTLYLTPECASHSQDSYRPRFHVQRKAGENCY